MERSKWFWNLPCICLWCQNDHHRRLQLYLSVINVNRPSPLLREFSSIFTFYCRGGKRSKSGHSMLESITGALKRLSVIHKIACIATNHMYAEMSCSCLPTHRSVSIQCVVVQIFALYFGLFLVSIVCDIACSCFSQCWAGAYTTLCQKIERASSWCLRHVAHWGTWSCWVFCRHSLTLFLKHEMNEGIVDHPCWFNGIITRLRPVNDNKHHTKNMTRERCGRERLFVQEWHAICWSCCSCLTQLVVHFSFLVTCDDLL